MNTKLDDLISQLQGSGIEMPLSKFVALNFSILKEFKKFHVPLKVQAEIISKSINKPVSVSSLAVAISRLNLSSTKNNSIKENNFRIKKNISERFVDKNAKLIFGTQKEIVQIIKDNVIKEEERIIDWRGLAPNEKVSNWILEYKDKLIAINLTGWRWKQIAEAINKHLELKKKISTNTLTSIISISNKKYK